eukprot:8335524-Pyramimonas_sp.AAC.1
MAGRQPAPGHVNYHIERSNIPLSEEPELTAHKQRNHHVHVQDDVGSGSCAGGAIHAPRQTQFNKTLPKDKPQVPGRGQPLDSHAHTG